MQDITNQNLKITQNFLKDSALVKKLVDNSNIKEGDFIVEIGPGKGIITIQLLKAIGESGKVLAIELDKDLFNILNRKFKEDARLTILEADFLTFNLSNLNGKYKVFSNVPFNITSQLLEHLLNPISGPSVAYLILQKDTLLIDKDNNNGETFKSLLIKPIYEIKSVYSFKRSDFIPQPSINTELFMFTKRKNNLVDISKYQLYKDFITFVSIDRAGEGAWNKVFSKEQLNRMSKEIGLIKGRGIKSQNFKTLIEAFNIFIKFNLNKHSIVKNAFINLRFNQKIKDVKNTKFKHHRLNRNK